MSRLDDATTSRLYIEISTESPSRFESIQDESKLQKFPESKVYFEQRYLVISIKNFVYLGNLEFENFGEKKVDGIYGVG